MILHDDLVPQAILALAAARRDCERGQALRDEEHYPGRDQRPDGRACARGHRSVVRLKSGDPLIFGRAAEEMAALNEAAVPFEVVPGITAAFAAAAAIPCSLTDRHAASNVIFSTGHHAQSHNERRCRQLEDATRIVYMPGRDLTLLAGVAARGLPADFPARSCRTPRNPDSRCSATTLANSDRCRPTQFAKPADRAGWAVARHDRNTLITG